MTAQAYRRQLVADKQSGSSVCDVADPSVGPVVLPVGFERFHRRGFLNYQFNRAYGLGWADGNELQDAAARTRSTEDCMSVFEDLSAQAAADGRLRHAVGYLRLAEFFTPPRSAAKVERYRRFRALFDAAFAGGGLIRHAIPYAGASLPAYWLPEQENASPVARSSSMADSTH